MSAVLEVRKQTALLSQDSLRDFVKIPNEWTASVRSKDIDRSGPAIFLRRKNRDRNSELSLRSVLHSTTQCAVSASFNLSTGGRKY